MPEPTRAKHRQLKPLAQRRGGSVRDFAERLGFYRPEVKRRLAGMNRPVWLHAVSVGEVLVARKIVAAWQKIDPAAEFD